MQGDWYKPGAWNAICDVCGFRFKSDQLRKNWKGLMVCQEDYETRHPQEFIRVKTEKIAVPWARPEGDPTYLFVCYLWERMAYADLATADCAMADYTPVTYTVALKLKTGN